MSCPHRVFSAVLLLGCAVLPSVAGADPIRITSGFLSVDYDFSATAPTPEPASLVLLGSGLAAVFARRLTRRRQGERPM